MNGIGVNVLHRCAFAAFLLFGMNIFVSDELRTYKLRLSKVMRLSIVYLQTVIR